MTMSALDDNFPTDATGLPVAGAPTDVRVEDGQTFELVVAPVGKSLDDATLRVLAYNGTVPGPTLRVRHGSEIIVEIENRVDLETTVHWHGLRLDNRYDGTHETQRPIAVGDSFTARVKCPDPGVY